MRYGSAVLLLASLGASLAAAPVNAQTDGASADGNGTSRESMLIVYGDDPCPQTANGDIVVCARRPESERYRIPPRFRKAAPGADGLAWGARVEDLDQVGKAGTGSCTSVGPGGWTGCYAEFMRQARKEREARKGEVTQIP